MTRRVLLFRCSCPACFRHEAVACGAPPPTLVLPTLVLSTRGLRYSCIFATHWSLKKSEGSFFLVLPIFPYFTWFLGFLVSCVLAKRCVNTVAPRGGGNHVGLAAGLCRILRYQRLPQPWAAVTSFPFFVFSTSRAVTLPSSFSERAGPLSLVACFLFLLCGMIWRDCACFVRGA